MLSRLELRLSFKIDVAREQNALIDIAVKSLYTDIEFRMVCYDLVRRLPLLYEWRYNSIHLKSLMLCQVYPFSS